jgi:hypothetical protein
MRNAANGRYHQDTGMSFFGGTLGLFEGPPFGAAGARSPSRGVTLLPQSASIDG